MPLPFDEFPASAATVDLTTGEISYEAAGALASGGTVAGEVVTAAAEVGIAAALAEPALIVGAGLLGLMAIDAAVKQFTPTRSVPNFTQLYQGGQTNGTRYQFTVEYTTTGGQTQSFTAQRNGPISGMQASINNQGSTEYNVVTGEGLFSVGAFPQGSLSTPPHITNVTRIGGQPDNGQNPAIVPASPGQFIIPTPTIRTVNQPNGDPITITCVPYPSIMNQPGVQPGQKAQPGILVAVPEAGMLINFTPTGVVIRYREPFASTSTAPRVPQLPPTVPYPPAECDCPPCDVKEVICRLKRLETDLLDDGYDYTDHPYSLGQGGIIDGIQDEFISFTINVQDSIQPIKKERASGTSDTVWYAGWYTFRYNGQNSDRNPISFEHCEYVAPVRANGFSVSIAYGGECTGVYTTRKKKPYRDNC